MTIKASISILTLAVLTLGFNPSTVNAKDTGPCYCTSGASSWCMGETCEGDYQGETTMSGCSAKCNKSSIIGSGGSVSSANAQRLNVINIQDIRNGSAPRVLSAPDKIFSSKMPSRF